MLVSQGIPAREVCTVCCFFHAVSLNGTCLKVFSVGSVFVLPSFFLSHLLCLSRLNRLSHQTACTIAYSPETILNMSSC